MFRAISSPSLSRPSAPPPIFDLLPAEPDLMSEESDEGDESEGSLYSNEGEVPLPHPKPLRVDEEMDKFFQVQSRQIKALRAELDDFNLSLPCCEDDEEKEVKRGLKKAKDCEHLNENKKNNINPVKKVYNNKSFS